MEKVKYRYNRWRLALGRLVICGISTAGSFFVRIFSFPYVYL